MDIEENLTGAVAGPKSSKMSPLVLHFPVKSGLQSGIVRQNVIKYSCYTEALLYVSSKTAFIKGLEKILTMSTVRPVNSVNIEHYIVSALKYAEYEENEDGTWTVTVPILPGVVTYGETKEEATEMLKDAIRNWVEVAEQFGDPIPDIEDHTDL